MGLASEILAALFNSCWINMHAVGSRFHHHHVSGSDLDDGEAARFPEKGAMMAAAINLNATVERDS